MRGSGGVDQDPDCFDVFNGDADGLCALQQLRLVDPRPAACITGVKRDINLLERVPLAEGLRIRVLDLSLDKNRSALLHLLAAGAEVCYVDHHHSGSIPDHPGLQAVIDTDGMVCTATLVDRMLEGAQRPWAVVGAFGDNLEPAAWGLCEQLGWSRSEGEAARRLGILLNYNSYGMSLEDLFFTPEELLQSMHGCRDPLQYADSRQDILEVLAQGMESDLAAATGLRFEYPGPEAALLRMPDAAWARRVAGVYGNMLARQHPGRAHALLIERPDGDYMVSVRAPLRTRAGADALCRQFASGGGRAGAAGINRLPAEQLDEFSSRFAVSWAR